MYALYKKLTQIFGNARFPILCKPVRLCAACLTDMEEKQTELETENRYHGRSRWHHSVAGTWHRRMQEVNSLCTDSGPLPAEYSIVGIPHNTAI